MESLDLFQEDNEAIKKFSTIVFFVFIYYTFSYYFLTKSDQCIKKPHITKIVGLILFHIIHILAIKYLHNQEMYAYCWIIAIIPIFIYLVYTKYTEMMKRKEDRKMKELYAKLQSQQNQGDPEFMRNVVKQGPKKSPMRGQNFVGIQNNGNRRGDNLPYHQQQHNDPLPPDNPVYNNPQVNIAYQPQQENMSNTFQGPPQYDQNYNNNVRQINNNTTQGQIQPLEKVDINPPGGMAGSGGLMGFDDYGSNFASF